MVVPEDWKALIAQQHFSLKIGILWFLHKICFSHFQLSFNFFIENEEERDFVSVQQLMHTLFKHITDIISCLQKGGYIYILKGFSVCFVKIAPKPDVEQLDN